MNWYLQSGKESDIAINTRIRFSRNIQGYRFNLSPKELQELENKIKENIYQIGYGLRFIKLQDMDDITKLSLVEKGLMNYHFAFQSGNMGAILVNDEENLAEELLDVIQCCYGIAFTKGIKLDECIGKHNMKLLHRSHTFID